MPFLRHGGLLATGMNSITLVAQATAKRTENAEAIAFAITMICAMADLTAVMTLSIGAIMAGRGQNVQG